MYGGLKLVAKDFLYSEQQGLEIKQVHTLLLWELGGNRLDLLSYSDRHIMKMGSWKSKTFLEYTREELGSFFTWMSSQ